MIQFALSLEYSLHSGWLAPFVDAIRKGEAMAWQCSGCERVSFPPARVCACGGRRGDWTHLSGLADIDWRTQGEDGAFALVKFDGAHTRSVVRLRDLGSEDRRGRLINTGSDIPQLVIGKV